MTSTIGPAASKSEKRAAISFLPPHDRVEEPLTFDVSTTSTTILAIINDSVLNLPTTA